MKFKPDPNQFEFDWIALHLVTVPEPTLPELETMRQKLGWPPPRNEDEVSTLRDLTVRLSWLDLSHDEQRISINEELSRARVIFGKEEWARSKKFWRRLAKRNPLALLKIILVAQKEKRLS